MYWPILGLLFGLSALLCCMGFWKLTYFLSIGYGFAIAGCGIAELIIYLLNPTSTATSASTPMWIVIVQAALFVIYGARLSGFLLYRELKNASFRATDLKKETLSTSNKEKKTPFFVLFTIWISVAALYAAMVSPMLFRFKNGSTDIIVPSAGFGISVLGLLLESAADRQKTAQKKVRPDMVATKGLYRMVRCPNYFGEIVFWTGVFVSGVTTYIPYGQWITAAIAYVCIVLIMFNGAKRLEKRQMARYENNKEYNDYADSTPIIIPLLPIYHLNGKKKAEIGEEK